MKPISQPIIFMSGSKQARGVLHLPRTVNPPLVVGSHGLEGTMDSAKQTLLARILPQAGIAFFRFDHLGCGRSTGNFLTDTSLDSRALDLVSAVRHILSLSVTDTRIALFGSSLGGATCIESWDILTRDGIVPRGAVLCSAPVVSRTIVNLPTEANASRPALPKRFFEQNLVFDVSGKATSMHSVLIFHGDMDEVVPVSNAHLLFKVVGNPKKLIIHKNGDHRMTSIRDQEEFETEALIWFKACFSPERDFS
ncbi:MAG: alpha/beta hydrolase [Pseudomonadota bacterium]